MLLVLCSSCLQIKSPCNVNPCCDQESCPVEEMCNLQSTSPPKRLAVCMQICLYVGYVVLRAFTSISLKKERGKKYLVSSIFSIFLFLKRSENLLMYNKLWYVLFLALMTYEEIHSGLLSDFQDGKSEPSLPCARGNIFWRTWIVEMVGSGLGWTLLKASLFLATSSPGYINVGNSLQSLPASWWISHPLFPFTQATWL